MKEKLIKMLNIIYNKNKENTLSLFLQIQNKDKQRIEAEKMLLYRGLESGMHSFSHLARELLENKTSKQAKGFLKYALKENNLAYLIDICKAYFPSGNSKGASENGKWFFSKFKEMLERTKKDYEKDGDSYRWAKSFDHLVYINLVLNNN